MTAIDSVKIARGVLKNPKGWSFEYLTPWKEWSVVLAFNVSEQEGDSGLPIYILVKDGKGRYATADETFEIMNLSLPDIDEFDENPREIVTIS